MSTTIQVAQIAVCTEAEGPGKRFAIWFQGCPLRCPGCCNPEFLPFRGGERRSIQSLTLELQNARDEQGIEGLTLLGGEPFAHAGGAVELARAARSIGLSVMAFSGYTIEHLQASDDPSVAELLALLDILVDGPYNRDEPDTERRWVGSRNQKIHFMTDRYSYDDQWKKSNTLEIRMVDGGISINGFPAPDAVELWKGWKRSKPAASPNASTGLR